MFSSRRREPTQGEALCDWLVLWDGVWSRGKCAFHGLVATTKMSAIEALMTPTTIRSIRVRRPLTRAAYRRPLCRLWVPAAGVNSSDMGISTTDSFGESRIM